YMTDRSDSSYWFLYREGQWPDRKSMADKPKPNQQPDGEVVYRRVVPPAAGGKKERRLDPTLAPLVAGFALLLLLIWVLGSLSVRRLEDTSRAALDLEHGHAARAALLLQMRSEERRVG